MTEANQQFEFTWNVDANQTLMLYRGPGTKRVIVKNAAGETVKLRTHAAGADDTYPLPQGGERVADRVGFVIVTGGGAGSKGTFKVLPLRNPSTDSSIKESLGEGSTAVT